MRKSKMYRLDDFKNLEVCVRAKTTMDYVESRWNINSPFFGPN